MTSEPAKNAVFVVETFKAFYRDLAQIRLDDLSSVYDDKVVFRDPVHQIRGINALHSYMTEMCANVSRGRFEYLDQLIGDDSAYIKWNMHFCHRSLGDRPITVRGMSQIQFEQRIVYHEDVYDMGEMIYEQVPVIGPATRWLKRRLAVEAT